MNIIFTGEPFPDEVSSSIFLAGPTPRKKSVKSWRPEALSVLESLHYNGHVFLPEHRFTSAIEEDETESLEKRKQRIEWETEGLNRAGTIVFWIPRDLETMPAFTTNIEWGIWADSGKAIFGAPSNAPKNEHIRLMAERLNVPQFETLSETLACAVTRLKDEALRTKRPGRRCSRCGRGGV